MRHLLTVRRMVPALALAAASWASAESVTFYTTPSAANGDDLIFTTGSGLAIVASAYESTRLDPLDILFSGSAPVTLGASGLGINGQGYPPFISDPSDQIDGVGADEFFLLTFSTPVSLNGVTLGRVDRDGSDHITIWDLDTDSGLFPVAPDVAARLSNPDTQKFQSLDLTGENMFGSRFLFSVGGGLINDFSDYSLAAVNVTAIPLPPAALSGLALLVSAGLAKACRRRTD